MCRASIQETSVTLLEITQWHVALISWKNSLENLDCLALTGNADTGSWSRLVNTDFYRTQKYAVYIFFFISCEKVT